MKYLFYTAVVAGSLCCAQGLKAQDPVKLSPDQYKVILSNKHVRVLDVVLKPGAKSAMHSHPDSVVYVIKGGMVRFTDAKGKSKEMTLKTGECLWREDEKHAVENIGKTTLHVLQLEEED